MLKSFSRLLVTLFILSSCGPSVSTATETQSPSITPTIESPTATLNASTAQPTPHVEIVNPLTGLAVEDPALLKLPASLVSISHFPPTARPQSGLSFAPFVFEIYITEGATRFLTAFYGEIPEPEVPIVGNCDVRKDIFVQTDLLLGSHVWNDANRNGIHEDWETGIGGVCVYLYDSNHELLQQTTTDTNGYYGFNVGPGNYYVAFLKPDGMKFAQKNAGDESRDSDVDPVTAWTDAVNVTASILTVDAGLIPLNVPETTSNLPPAKIGPVRSGRLVYADIAAFFPQSCLIYAFASAEVLVELPKCAFVFHEIQGGGYMMNIDEMVQETKDHQQPDTSFDYTSNVFSDQPPTGGTEASRLDTYFAWLNQSAWVYDPLYQSWWRYVDMADPDTAGVLHAEVDRLTNRQLHFENVLVLFAEHEVISPTNLSIHLEHDWAGDAILFRDGKKYDIRWSTVASEEEVQTGNRKPIQFLNADNNNPFPLKPGHTWVIVATPKTAVTETSAGKWLLQFSYPPGAK